MNGLDIRAERKWMESHPGQVLDEARPLHAQSVSYAVEDYRGIEGELRELYPAHWQEIALDHDVIPLDVDYSRYWGLAEAGVLHIVTARHADKIVGYHVSMIHPHLHYKSSLTCFSDVFYLKPEYRKGLIGYRLLQFFRDSVKKRGVQKIYMSIKLDHDVGRLLERLGFNPIERVYSMVFK
jgi:GNAT superfamily N-acetyltransferase